MNTKTSLVLAGSALASLSVPRAIIGGRAGVRADASDPRALFAQLNQAFEEFKATNDQAVGAKVDALVTEKVTRIDGVISELQAALDQVNARMVHSQISEDEKGRRLSPEASAYINAFDQFMRKGDANMKPEVYAALNKGVAEQGGFLTPVEWDRTITAALKVISAVRQYATVQPIGTVGYSQLFSDGVVGSGWVGETAARPATTTPGFTSLSWDFGEIYANPQASQGFIDDAAINTEDWLANEVQTEFARQEGLAFISGDGTNKPRGFATYVTGAANAARHPGGAIELVNSGAAADVTADAILTLIYALPAMYSGNARFFANRLTVSRFRKMKDGQGNYLWQPSFAADQPATLAGQAIVDLPDLPNVGAGTIPLFWGDMRETYLVLDRMGIRVLRDPFTNKPFVGFYTTKRVGGGVKNPKAMKGMLIGA